jgi:hypothetical protein
MQGAASYQAWMPNVYPLAKIVDSMDKKMKNTTALAVYVT